MLPKMTENYFTYLSTGLRLLVPMKLADFPKALDKPWFGRTCKRLFSPPLQQKRKQTFFEEIMEYVAEL